MKIFIRLLCALLLAAPVVPTSAQNSTPAAAAATNATNATTAASSPAPPGALRDLAWSNQGNALFFTGTHEGKPVNMVRTGLPGKGSWSIYTGTLDDRVRLTWRDGQGLVDVLALDKGYRITVRTVAAERAEYRLYGADRRFLIGAVLFRDASRRWMQGFMRSEAFPGYAALTQVSDVSARVNVAGVVPRSAESLSVLSSLSAWRLPHWADFALIASAHAQGLDDLAKGFFSDSAREARSFFAPAGNVMGLAGGLGLAAFTVKLLGQSDLVVAVAGAGTVTGLAPVLVAMGAGVAIGVAADKVVNWAESKNIPGRMGDLYERLMRKTRYSEEPPPVAPGLASGAPGPANTPEARAGAALADSQSDVEKMKRMLALSEQLDMMDRMDFERALDNADACRSAGKFECADGELNKASKYASTSKSRQQLAQARQSLADARQAAEEARRREEQRQLALAEEQRRRDAAAREAEQARASGSGSDAFGRLAFGALGLGLIGRARGLASEDKISIAKGFVRDMSGEGQGQGLAEADREISARRAATASAGRPAAGGAAGSAAGRGAAASLDDSMWHDDLTVHENPTGREKLFRNHEPAVPGSVMRAQMWSQSAAQAFFGTNGARVTSYTGCGACGVGSTITVVVRSELTIDTHVFTRDR